MSFAIYAAGKVPDAIETVKATAGHGDTSQLDAAKAYIVAELEAWPTGERAPKGVLVEASGHHDSSISRNLSITIKPLYLTS